MRICGVADNLGNINCFWPEPLNKDVGIYVPNVKLGQISLRDAFEVALSGGTSWNHICNINLYLTQNNKTAKIVVAAGRIDGPGGILGQSGLPCGYTRNLWSPIPQQYDIDGNFVLAENPPAGTLDLARIVLHELGHAIGISHINTPNNLMNPTYNDRIRWLQEEDIKEAIVRYGKKNSSSPTPSIPDSMDKLFPCFIEIIKNLTPEQQADLIKMLINIWLSFNKDQKQKIMEALTHESS